VVVSGRLDDEVASRASAELLALDASGPEPIDLHVDCPDATLEAAFVLIDVMDLLHATVRAHCRGRAGGPAVGVVALAGRRSAAPHATFRLGQPVARFFGTADQIAEQSRQQRALLWRWQARLASVTGRPAEEVGDDLRRGRSLDAHEALAYGLIDEVRSAPGR
jgi:ATP-dependent Clp protease, protease subunit